MVKYILLQKILILILFNLGIPIKVIIDDTVVVIIKGIVKLLALK